MHEVLVNRLGGLSLPRKSVVRLTDRPDMTLDVYRGRKTTIQQIQQPFVFIDLKLLFYLPLFLFYTNAYLYSISFPFLFYTVNLFVLFNLFIYFLQAISLAKLSRPSSSLDRLTSNRTNTKTDRL